MIKRSTEKYRDVERTLQVMAAMAQEQKKNPKVRKITDSLTTGITFPPGRDGRREIASRIWRFVKREIRYINDPAGAELVQAPDAILKTRHGDCDGMATLSSAMLASVGIEAGYRAVAWETPGVFEHVYTIYAPYMGAPVEAWHALDTVTPSPTPGPDTIQTEGVDTKDYTLAQHDSLDIDTDMAQLLSNQPTRALGRSPLGDRTSTDPASETQFDSFADFLQYAFEKGPEYVRAWRESGSSPAPDSTVARLAALEERLRLLRAQESQGPLGTTSTLLVSGAAAAGIVYLATR